MITKKEAAVIDEQMKRLEHIELHHWPLFDLRRGTQDNRAVLRLNYIRKDLLDLVVRDKWFAGNFERTMLCVRGRIDELETLCGILSSS